MTSWLALSEEQQFDAAPDEVYALFGAGPASGWLFDVRTDRVALGSAVTLFAPLDGPAADPVEIRGRIAALRPPNRIDIVHDQPLRGRLRITIQAVGAARSRVRITEEFDVASLEWLLRRWGHAVDRATTDDGVHRIGLLTSKTGPGSVFAAGTEHLAELAVEEINADGGLRGHRVELVVGDDATDPAMGLLEARRLAAAGCRAVMATTTSATFNRAAAALTAQGVLAIQTLMNEGGPATDHCFRFGERPYDQLRAATPTLMAEGARRWFLAGNDYVWPRMVNRMARRVAAELGAGVAGESYAPLGTTDFAPIIEQIQRSAADLVISSFVGSDLVAFERQCEAMGLRQLARSLAPALDGPTRELIGDRASAGLWGVSGYFAEIPSDDNRRFLARYRDRFGAYAPPVSSIAESLYEAVHLYASAVRGATGGEAGAVSVGLRSGRFHFPRGEIVIDGPTSFHQELYLAEAVSGGFAVRPLGGLAGP